MSDTEITTSFDVPPAPPYDDDDEPEFRPRPRRRARTLTYLLGGLVLLGAGFLGGVFVQKHEGKSSSSANSALSALASRFGRNLGSGSGSGSDSGGGGGFRGGGGGGFGGAEVGQVKLVDGNNVYITDTSGNVVKVTTNGASQLSKTTAATLKDIAPGDTVIVRGTQNSDGSYTASDITDGGTSGAGALGGFGGGSGSSATGAAASGG